MKLMIDDAHIEQIKKIYEFYPVDGVTTNPSILYKVGRKPFEVLKEIREFIGENSEMHVQATAETAEGMVEDAKYILEQLGENTFIKIPAIQEGFKAMKILHRENMKFTATAIYTPMQAFLAAKAGASYTAPYVNRLDNLGYDGVQVAKDIHDIFCENDFDTEVLAASFKNSQQILELCKYGVGAATVAPDVIFSLVKNKVVESAVDDFISDFTKLVGEGKTMKDC
ncbi:MAG: fructose-6-phosphate aldolase [Selenomonadaceae bacterium]|nr:fructose-6-phosphate aldolase [Selenomonadaceae bacterium]